MININYKLQYHQFRSNFLPFHTKYFYALLFYMFQMHVDTHYYYYFIFLQSFLLLMIAHQYSFPTLSALRQIIPTQSSNSTVSYKINNRFKNMTIEERQHRFTFKNKKIINQLRLFTCSKNLPESLMFLKAFKDFNESKVQLLIPHSSNSKELQNRIDNREILVEEFLNLSYELINNIVVISKDELFDNLTINQRFLTNIQYFFWLFEKMDLLIEQNHLKSSIQDTKFIEQKNLHDLGIKLHQVIKNHILEQEELCNFQNKQKQRVNKLWKQMTIQKKLQILRLGNYKQITKSYKFLTSDMLKELVTDLPSQRQIEDYIKKINLIYRHEVYDFLTQNTLLECCSSISIIKWIIMLEINKVACETSKNSKRRKNKNKKKKTQTTEVQDQDPVQLKQTKYQKEKVKKATTLKSQNDNAQQINNKKKQLNTKDQVKPNFKSQNEDNSRIVDKNKKRLLISFQQDQKKQQLSYSYQFNQRKKIIQKIYSQKLKNDLIEVTDNISEIANSFTTYRIIAFNRIRYLLNLWNISLKIFGSCASGLALPDSDIDLAVDPAILNYYCYNLNSVRQQICSALTGIYQLLQTKPWVNNLKLILTASIPVLKFEINPLIIFQQAPKDPYMNIFKEKNKKISVKVDLTIEYNFSNNFEDLNHLGVIATQDMNEWLDTYPSLRILILTMKYLLKKKQLNNVYKGGLSCYCVMVMAIAYLNHKNLNDQKRCANIFYGFIDFYTQDFRHEKIGIDIRKENKSAPFFDITENSNPDKIQVKDPLNGKIISLNSYKYGKILQEWRKLKDSKKKIQSELAKYLTNLSIKIPQKSKIFSKNFLQQYLQEQNLGT